MTFKEKTRDERGQRPMSTELVLGQQTVQRGAADSNALRDLGLGHSCLEGIGCGGGDGLHRGALLAADALQGLAESVESATGFDVGCVGDGVSVNHLPQNVNRVTLAASSKRARGVSPPSPLLTEVHPMSSSAKRNVVSDFFAEPIFYGGLICTRAEAIGDMEEQDMDQRCIDRWMQGAQLAPEPSVLVIGGEEFVSWDAIGVTPAARGEGPTESVAHYFEVVHVG